MDLTVLVVPYDTARRDARMGRGPARLLEGGLVAALADAGHQVRCERIEADERPATSETAMTFDLNRRLAEAVRRAVNAGTFPLVLAGNCGTAVGTLAGLGSGADGVVWFDAHADFNTPDTTVTGFLDGMALAMVTGRCWTSLAAGVPGFRPVPEERVLLVGARDLDEQEAVALAGSGVQRVSADAARAAGFRAVLEPALRTLPKRGRGVYVHLDLDVLDPTEARVNQFAAPGGLTSAEVVDALHVIGEQRGIAAAAFTAYDPSSDPAACVPPIARRLLEALLQPLERGARM
ncbi:MAG: arginase family protein [Gemmatimonadales bacterium]